MAKGHFSVHKLTTEVLSGAGLSRNNRFEVKILPPPALAGRGNDAELCSLYVEQASLPLLNIFAKPFKIFGPTYQRPITSEYGGEGLPITFHVDRGMRVRRFFEDWMHSIIDPDSFEVSFQEEYAASIFIAQLDEQENIVYEVELLEAFPRNLNIMDINQQSSNQTHRLNVLFAYRYWKNTERVQAVDIPRPLQTPQVPTFDLRLPETRRQFDWSTGTLDYQPGSDFPPSA